MMRAWRAMGAAILAMAMLTGCNPSGVKVETYEIKTVSGIEQAKQLLQQYANGGPLGSEVTSYPQIVEQVKKDDPKKGEILEQGLAELQQAGANRAEKAKALLKQL